MKYSKVLDGITTETMIKCAKAELGEYPCAGCKSKNSSCIAECPAWPIWFKCKWEGIQKAAAQSKLVKREILFDFSKVHMI